MKRLFGEQQMSSLADLVQTALMLNSNKRAVGCMVPAPLGLILFKLCMVGAAVGGGDCDSLDIGREFEISNFDRNSSRNKVWLDRNLPFKIKYPLKRNIQKA